MRQRDSEHTLQAYFLPFRPENNSPFSRHYFTRVLLLCLWYDHYNSFRAKMQEENAPNLKIRGIFLVRFVPPYSAVEAAAALAAAAFSAWAFLTALYFSFSSAVAMGRMASRGQTLVHILQPMHLS